MKKGFSSILGIIIGLFIGIIIGVVVCKFTFKDDLKTNNIEDDEVSNVPNDANDTEEQYIKIDETNIVNRPESKNDEMVIYQNIAQNIDSDLFKDIVTVNIKDNSIEVKRKDESNLLSDINGKIIETMNSPMGDGADGFIFFLTDKGVVYYVDVYGELVIKKIEGIPSIKNLAWIEASRVVNLDPGDGKNFIHRSARNTTIAITEDGKIYDLWESMKAN